MRHRIHATRPTQAAIIIGVIIVASVLAIYAYVVSQPSPSAKTSLLFGASLPLTGGQGPYGTEMNQAYKFAVAEINAQGGLYISSLGKKLPITLTVLDDESNPSIVVTNYQRLIQVDKVDFLFGEVGTVDSLAAAPIAEANHIPIIGTIQSVLPKNQANNNYVFDLWPNSVDFVLALTKMLKSLSASQQPKTFLLWTDDTTLGQTYLKAFESTLPQEGYKIVATDAFPHGASDFSPLVTRAEQVNPDVIVVNNQFTPDTINIIKEMKLLNFNPRLGIFALQATAGQFGQALGKDANHALGDSVWTPSANWPGNKKFSEMFARTYGIQGVNAGQGYAAAQILLTAIQTAGSLDRVAVDQQLWKTNMNTVMGPISFTQSGPDRGRAIVTPLLVQWQNSQSMVVWPTEVSTAQLWWPWMPWKGRE